MPSQISDVYTNGSTEQKIEFTTSLAGTIAGFVKGKTAVKANIIQSGFKLPKLSIAFWDYFTKGVHSYVGKGEALYYLDKSGQISVKAVGRNLSSKNIKQIVNEGMNALSNESYRNGMKKKLMMHLIFLTLINLAMELKY